MLFLNQLLNTRCNIVRGLLFSHLMSKVHFICIHLKHRKINFGIAQLRLVSTLLRKLWQNYVNRLIWEVREIYKLISYIILIIWTSVRYTGMCIFKKDNVVTVSNFTKSLFERIMHIHLFVKQLIMERTGHLSMPVWQNKHTSSKLVKSVRKIIGGNKTKGSDKNNSELTKSSKSPK